MNLSCDTRSHSEDAKCCCLKSEDNTKDDPSMDECRYLMTLILLYHHCKNCPVDSPSRSHVITDMEEEDDDESQRHVCVLQKHCFAMKNLLIAHESCCGASLSAICGKCEFMNTIITLAETTSHLLRVKSTFPTSLNDSM